jgi:murein DD-endopeptidase MepM/ murein hydrolase activator NlpD
MTPGRDGGRGTTAAATTARQVLAHVLTSAGAVGGLALALLLASALPEPSGPPREQRTLTAAVPRGAAQLEPEPDLPLPALAGRVVAGSRAFPVAAEADYARDHHDYPATDLFVACGTPVLAVAAGVVSETSVADLWDRGTNAGADRGGLSVTLLGDDGVRYYGSHLSAVLVEPGQRVRAGEVLGAVGDTGSAAGTGCHLHLGLSPASCGPGDWFTRRGAVSPFPFLESWRTGVDADPAPEVRSWRRTHGCPTEPTAYP